MRPSQTAVACAGAPIHSQARIATSFQVQWVTCLTMTVLPAGQVNRSVVWDALATGPKSLAVRTGTQLRLKDHAGSGRWPTAALGVPGVVDPPGLHVVEGVVHAARRVGRR